MRVVIVLGLCLTWSAAAAAQSRAAEMVRRVSDSSEVARLVERYHDALALDDTATVYRLLAPTAVYIDEDEILTMADMRARGAAAKGRWERAVQRERGTIHVRVAGDAAWAYWVWPMHARAQPELLRGTEAELMVLMRSAAGWQITAVHTSLRSR